MGNNVAMVIEEEPLALDELEAVFVILHHCSLIRNHAIWENCRVSDIGGVNGNFMGFGIFEDLSLTGMVNRMRV